MTVEVYQGGSFSTSHERFAVTNICNALQKKFGESDNLYVVLLDFKVGGKDIDLTILKKDLLLIVELKSESRAFVATEGEWVTEDGDRVGKNYSPFAQVKDYRYAWKCFLQSKAEHISCLNDLEDDELDKISWFTTCAVAIDPCLPEGFENRMGPGIKWFHLCGVDDLPKLIELETTRDFNFNDSELRMIAQKFLGLHGPYAKLVVDRTTQSSRKVAQPHKVVGSDTVVHTEFPGHARNNGDNDSLKPTKQESCSDQNRPTVSNSGGAIRSESESAPTGSTRKRNVLAMALVVALISSIYYYQSINGLGNANETSAGLIAKQDQILIDRTNPSVKPRSVPKISEQSLTVSTTPPGPLPQKVKPPAIDDDEAIKLEHDHVEIPSNSIKGTNESLRYDYVRASVRNGPRSPIFPAWTIVAWNEGGKYNLLAEEIKTLLFTSEIPEPLNLFSDRFYSDGRAEQVLAGKEDIIYDSGISEFVDGVLFVRSRELLLPQDQQYPNLKSARVELDILIFPLSDASSPSSHFISGTAAGFSPENATQKATRLALGKIQEDFRRVILNDYSN